MTLWPFAILTTLIGACVGSFLNVVIYRLPAGLSIVTPPSSCPKCSHRLAAYDNVPVLGWLWLRGKCRYCRNPISVQYPIVEAFGALMFLGLFLAYYITGDRPDFTTVAAESGVVFAMHLILLGALIASSKIDANLYIIPLEIPWTVTLLSLVMFPAAAWIVPASWPVMPHAPELNNWGCAAAFGGVIGLVISEVLRARGVLPTSFLEPEKDVAAENSSKKEKSKQDKAKGAADARGAKASKKDGKHETAGASASGAAKPKSAKNKTLAVLLVFVVAVGAWWFGGLAGRVVAFLILWGGVVLVDFGAYGNSNPADEHGPEEWYEFPHPRLEALKELLYLFMPVAGFVAGAVIASIPNVAAMLANLPLPLKALGGVMFGFLAGGGIVWATRIFGTLLFGKEAMGLGDVHLLAGVGAVLGWADTTLVFFLAPFLGLAGAAVTRGVATLWRGQVRVIPYGPYLAIATVLMMAFRGPIYVAVFKLTGLGP